MEGLRFLNLEYLFLVIYNFLTGNHAFTIPPELLSLWVSFKILATFGTLFLLTGIVYSLIRIDQIRKRQRAELGIVAMAQTSEEVKNTRWQQVLDHVASDNPNDWRQAIMEADIILDEMLTVMNYQGENLGEKLKQVERSDFDTLDQAWEAHKVRNEIAHQGSNFLLTDREARRVIDLYRQVFEEFRYI